jgi:hypothetical protein
MKLHALGLLLTAFCAVSSIGHAEEMTLVTPDQMKWGPLDVIPGAKLAVVSGDPSKPGPFVLEIQWPGGSKIGPHWHSAIERVTILSGTGILGMGDSIDRQKATTLPAGGYAALPATMHHWFLAETPILMMIEGDGPFDVHFVHPEDDPSKKTAKE